MTDAMTTSAVQVLGRYGAWSKTMFWMGISSKNVDWNNPWELYAFTIKTGKLTIKHIKKLRRSPDVTAICLLLLVVLDVQFFVRLSQAFFSRFDLSPFNAMALMVQLCSTGRFRWFLQSQLKWFPCRNPKVSMVSVFPDLPSFPKRRCHAPAAAIQNVDGGQADHGVAAHAAQETWNSQLSWIQPCSPVVAPEVLDVHPPKIFG